MIGRPPEAQRQIIKYILEYFYANSKYPLNIEIANHFQVSNARICRVADILEKKGYIKRRKSKINGLSEYCEDFVKGIKG